MTALTVHLEAVAALRQTVQATTADPIAAALRAESAGADGIGVYLREDRRYLQEKDVHLLRQTIHSRLILFMAATSEMVGFALDVKPERVVLMPALHDDGTTDAGLDLIVDSRHLFETVDTLQSNNISVGVCIAPEPDQVKLAHQARANWIHIHSGRLKSATSAAMQSQELNRIIDALKMAHRLRLHIAIGHDLDERLLKLFSGIEEVDEFNLGRNLMAKALMVGIETAVRDAVATIRTL